MIISHSRQFVFMHTPKTAGNSITRALVPLCAPDDIITGGPVRERNNTQYRPHTRAKQARAIIGEALWQQYFTFAVERNPWDKAVSRYFWQQRKDPGVADFSTWLRQIPPHRLSQTHIYCIGGEQAVDRVLRFENLIEDLRDVCRQIGIPPVELPTAHSSTRPAASRDWRSQYNAEDAAYVARVCRREIEMFGYTFDA